MGMRIVTVAVVLSVLAALATAAIFVRVEMKEMREEIIRLQSIAIEASSRSREAERFAAEIGTSVVIGQDGVSEARRGIAAIREEMDAMQTQIRLLKLAR